MEPGNPRLFHAMMAFAIDDTTFIHTVVPVLRRAGLMIMTLWLIPTTLYCSSRSQQKPKQHEFVSISVTGRSVRVACVNMRMMQRSTLEDMKPSTFFY